MPTKESAQIFRKAKNDIIQKLHGEYNVPRIDSSLLQPHDEQNGNRNAREGGFATVYKVAVVRGQQEHREQDSGLPDDVETVALKIIKEESLTSLLAKTGNLPSSKRSDYEEKFKKVVQKLLAYYERECIIWQRCAGDRNKAHDNNLVELYGLVDSYNGSLMPVFVSRYISEGTLRRYIKNPNNRVLSDRERILLISDVAKALSFLHSLDIVHRDIKADNILIEKTGERYIGLLGDFGSSKAVLSDLMKDVASSTMGDTRWEPPEYLNNNKARSEEKGPGDIWALGCTMLEVLQENCPWKPYPEVNYLEKLCNYEYPVKGETIDSTTGLFRRVPVEDKRFRHVEDRHYEFMKKCWRKNEDDRISAKEAHDELVQLAESCPVPVV